MKQKSNTYFNPLTSTLIISDSIVERRKLIEDKLRFYANHRMYCPAIGSDVTILSKSIDETANWGCTSVVGTKLCLLIEYVIANAVVLEIGLPTNSNRQSKKFKFISLATLKCNVPHIGVAKLTIGYRKNGNAIEYCITEYSEKK